mgnify:CR=1 FL=1
MNNHNQALRLKELNFLREIDTCSHITCLCTPKTFQYTKQTFIPLVGVKMTFIGILILAECYVNCNNNNKKKIGHKI